MADDQGLLAEIAAHPKSALIEALADAMHSIEDDDGTGRHISYYRSLAYATVEILPGLVYDEDATCDEPGCGAHPESEVHAEQAAAPDGPRTWQLPDEPGPEVTAVRTESGHVLDRDGDGWRYRTSGHVPGVVGTWRRWDGLVITEGRLTDATPAGGQDGDGHG